MESGRKYRVLRSLLVLFCLLPLQALALSLGDMVVRSVPGEPLRAHIPLTLQQGETLADIHVTLASATEYEQRHVPRAEVLQGVRIALLERGADKARIQIFGEQTWQGEEAQLLLLVSWDGGSLEQHFKLAAITPDEEATPVYVEVGQDETLDTIAMRLSKGRNRSYLHMMYALFLANPEAFYRGNLNNLKSGSTLRVPSDEELYRLADREVFDGIRQQYDQWKKLRESKRQTGSVAGEALSTLSAEQAAALDLSASPDALQKRLQEVSADSEAIRKENEALRQRLKQLEQRMQSVAGRVLDYAAEDGADSAPAVQPQPEEEKPEQSEEPEEAEAEGLSGTTMLAAIVMVLLFAFYILYSTGHPHRGRE